LPHFKQRPLICFQEIFFMFFSFPLWVSVDYLYLQSICQNSGHRRTILLSNNNSCLRLNTVQPLHSSLSILARKFKIMNRPISLQKTELNPVHKLKCKPGAVHFCKLRFKILNLMNHKPENERYLLKIDDNNK